MKKALIILGAVIVAVIAIAVIVPFLIPMEGYKREISTQVKEATGRDFTIAGKLSLSLLPNIALTAENVSLANVPASPEANMASLDKLHLSLKLMPLLSGKFVIDGFELVHPVIHLDVDKEGHGNWEFKGKAKEETPESKGRMADMLRDLTLADVRLSDGQITYSNAQTGKSMTFTSINTRLSLPHFDGPLKVDGNLDWNSQKIGLNFTAANLKSLIGGEAVAVTANVKSAPVNFSLSGMAVKGDEISLDGDVNVDAPSVRKLAAWAGKPMTTPGAGLGPLSIAGHLNKAGNQYVFSKANLRLDNIRAKGTLTLVTGGPRMKASGSLEAQDLDLNPYLTPEPPEKPKDWSVKPIDFSALKAADISFGIRTQSLEYRKIAVGPSTLGLDIDDGKLSADLKDMSLYGGKGRGHVDINGRGAVPDIRANFNLAGVNAEPLLRDAGGYNRLTGTLKTDLSITTHGKTQQDLVSALDGKGDFQFANGTLKGVDLAAIAETIEKISNGIKSGGAGMLQSLVSGDILGSLKSIATIFGGMGEVDKTTKFTSLNATWAAKSGTVSNNDLLLVGPYVNQRALFRMSGKGDVMLPAKEINYETDIRSFAKTDAGTGIGGKVRLTGPLANPDPCVVLGSLCIGKHTNPGDLVKAQLKGIIENSGKSGNGTEKPALPSTDKLRDIFKGLIP